MGDARRYARITCQLPVDISWSAEPRPHRCRTANISLGGMLAVGTASVLPDMAVEIGIGPRGIGQLYLNSRVAHVDGHGIGLAFVDNSPSELELLETLLAPVWDGTPLLDNVIRLAPWHEHDNLACWMRLTSLVAEWRKLKHV
jgi:hypothetical protein